MIDSQDAKRVLLSKRYYCWYESVDQPNYLTLFGFRIDPIQVALFLLAAIATLILCHILTHTLVRFVLEPNGNLWTASTLLQFFDFDQEGNVPSFFSSVILLTAASLFWLLGKVYRRCSDPRSKFWIGLAVIFLFLTLDESVQIHEKFDNNSLLSWVGTTGLLAWPWVILYGTLVLIFASIYFRFWWSLGASIRAWLAISGFLYVMAAIGFEMLGALAWTSHEGPTVIYLVLYSLEEALEMTAMALLIFALLHHINEKLSESANLGQEY